ncbi:MAG: hypothetical protein M1825_004769 [Sarcosagium campestre]|nr:MAG: hypothetical protein M1825_004769 [Sarcosagium campestre]
MGKYQFSDGFAVQALTATGVLNMLTDLLLILLPLSILVKASLTNFQFYHLLLLFSLGFFVIIITAIRVSQSYRDAASVSNHYGWFSAETIAATVVCQGPMIYTLLRRKSTPTPSSYASAESRAKMLSAASKSATNRSMVESDKPSQTNSWSDNQRDA